MISTYAVQQTLVPPSSSKRILAGPAVVSTVTTSGAGNGVATAQVSVAQSQLAAQSV